MNNVTALYWRVTLARVENSDREVLVDVQENSEKTRGSGKDKLDL